MEDKIVAAVMAKFQRRAEAGYQKYGTTMDRNDLSELEWLNHLQEELMDAVVYTQKLIELKQQSELTVLGDK